MILTILTAFSWRSRTITNVPWRRQRTGASARIGCGTSFRKSMGWGLAPWRGAMESKAPTKHARISLIPPLVPGCRRRGNLAVRGSAASGYYHKDEDFAERCLYSRDQPV